MVGDYARLAGVARPRGTPWRTPGMPSAPRQGVARNIRDPRIDEWKAHRLSTGLTADRERHVAYRQESSRAKCMPAGKPECGEMTLARAAFGPPSARSATEQAVLKLEEWTSKIEVCDGC